MAITNYNKIGAGLWGLDSVGCLPGKDSLTSYGLMLTGITSSADAESKDLKNAQGNTVGKVTYNSKASVSIKGYALAATNSGITGLPKIGDVIKFTGDTGQITNSTIGATTHLTEAMVTKVETTYTNEDYVQCSIEAEYNPSLTYPTPPTPPKP